MNIKNIVAFMFLCSLFVALTGCGETKTTAVPSTDKAAPPAVAPVAGADST